MFSEIDKKMMQQAITLARAAGVEGEVPVGAVLTLNNEIIAMGYNQPIVNHDPTAHAEIITLRKAAQAISNYRLVDTTLYVTLEPCTMCAGALVHARIKRLVFGAQDSRAGAVVSQAKVLEQPFLNHKVNYESGLFAEECGELLSKFFKERRR